MLSAAMQRVQLITELVRESQYTIDEQLVAAAILVRALLRLTIADASFRNDLLWS
jgi:hypothetical protein